MGTTIDTSPNWVWDGGRWCATYGDEGSATIEEACINAMTGRRGFCLVIYKRGEWRRKNWSENLQSLMLLADRYAVLEGWIQGDVSTPCLRWADYGDLRVVTFPPIHMEGGEASLTVELLKDGGWHWGGDEGLGGNSHYWTDSHRHSTAEFAQAAAEAWAALEKWA